MLAHVVVFWAVRLCRPVSGYKGFGGIFEVRGLSRTPTRVCVFFFFLKNYILTSRLVRAVMLVVCI